MRHIQIPNTRRNGAYRTNQIIRWLINFILGKAPAASFGAAVAPWDQLQHGREYDAETNIRRNGGGKLDLVERGRAPVKKKSRLPVALRLERHVVLRS